MKILVIVNGAAYGQDATYNALRLAGSLSKREGVDLTLFLMGDGVTCALDGQRTPEGFYNLASMVKGVAAKADVLCCGTCIDARGITAEMLVDGARRSTMDELTDRTLEAEKVLVF